jgi:hypothetical protein
MNGIPEPEAARTSQHDAVCRDPSETQGDHTTFHNFFIPAYTRHLSVRRYYNRTLSRAPPDE